jgi:hypothetical protein
MVSRKALETIGRQGLRISRIRQFHPSTREPESETVPVEVEATKRRRGRRKGTRNQQKPVPKSNEKVLGVRYVDHPSVPPEVWILLESLMRTLFRGLVRAVEKLKVDAPGSEQEAILFGAVPRLLFRVVRDLAAAWWSYDNGYLGPTLTCNRCHGVMKHAGNREKNLVSPYGMFRPGRAYYICTNPQCTVPHRKDPQRMRRYSLFPLDVRLGVDASSFLPSVQEVVVWLTSMDPYGKCLELIQKLLSFSISHRTAWLITQQVGSVVKSRQDECLAQAFSNPQAPLFPVAEFKAPDIGVVEVDGTYGPIERTEDVAETEDATEEDNPDAPPRPKDFQELKCGLVAHLVPPVPKRPVRPRPAATPASTETAVTQPVDSAASKASTKKDKKLPHRKVRPAGEEPTLDHKKLAVHLGKPLELFRMLLLLIYRLDLQHARVILVIGDGARWIWSNVREHFSDLGPQIVEILDFWHAVEHLWKLANSVFGQGSPEAVAWVNQQVTDLLKGMETRFFTALETLVAKAQTMGESIAKIGNDELRYFQNNAERMHYADYLANGYLIGSGAMEGTNNYHIKGRVDRAGMRWKPPGVMAVLRNRTLIQNEDWQAFWAGESQRRYLGYRVLVSHLTGAAAG